MKKCLEDAYRKEADSTVGEIRRWMFVTDWKARWITAWL